MPHSESADYGRLEKVVISLLAEGRPLTAAQLEQRVRDAQRRYSIQAIYHVLRKLRRQGIVIRVETRFSLSLTWALDLVDLARRIEQRVLSSAPATETVPETGETLCWRFSSITALDDFWTHLMLLLLTRTPTRRIYNFCPHPWFYYAHQASLTKFYNVLRRRGARIFVAIGGSTHLDRLFARSTDAELYSCIHASGVGVGGAVHKHVMVIGDFVIDVTLQRLWAEKLDTAFTTTKGSPHADLQRLQRLFQDSAPATFKVTHNAARAQRLTSKFALLFDRRREA